MLDISRLHASFGLHVGIRGGGSQKAHFVYLFVLVRSIFVSVSGWHHRLTDPGPLSSRSNAGRTGRAKRPRAEGASFLADLVERGARLRGVNENQ